MNSPRCNRGKSGGGEEANPERVECASLDINHHEFGGYSNYTPLGYAEVVHFFKPIAKRMFFNVQDNPGPFQKFRLFSVPTKIRMRQQ